MEVGGLELLKDLQQRYRQRYPASAALYDEAVAQTPGGVHGNLRHYPPFPLSFKRAEGARMIDVDGYTYTDYFLSYGSLILGHGHPSVREAVEKVWQIQGTSSFGTPHPMESEMVKVLREFYPSFESVRLTNSGLEATLLAVRLALAYTGRTHLAKFQGHYHGSHDQVLLNIHIDPRSREPIPVADSFGLPDYVKEHTVVLPFGDWESCEPLLERHKNHMGAVILEPMMGGYVPAPTGLVQNLRRWTQENSIPLIFDEVKTGFRVSLGGAQEYYGVKPDLTTLGKVVGGGFPIGVVGGKQEILSLCSPLRSQQPLFHSGTYNGNPMSLAAGLATMRQLSQPGYFDTIVENTRKLREGIEQLSEHYRAGWTTLGVGTIFNLVESGEPPLSKASGDGRLRRLQLDYLLMERGVFLKPMNRFSLSGVHEAQDIENTLKAFEQAFAALAYVKP
ncbi:MAG TPA: aspartate aminotransferase family protein [Alicyclobacillus sp.]|nr:aspartate aminotransferase family protein [Alicyclobacillus sp.]